MLTLPECVTWYIFKPNFKTKTKTKLFLVKTKIEILRIFFFSFADMMVTDDSTIFPILYSTHINFRWALSGLSDGMFIKEGGLQKVRAYKKVYKLT